MNRPSRSAHLKRVIVILLCLILVELAVLAFMLVRYRTGNARQEPSAQTQAAVTPTPSPEPTPVPVDLPETADMGQEYQDKLVFLGDSTTYGLGFYDVVPFTQVWTPASGTMALYNWAIETIDYYAPDSPDSAVGLSITDCAARRQPEVLVITLGINGIAMLDETSFKQHYTDLIQAIQTASPNTKIICQSLYPVIDSRAPGGISNAAVNTANVWVRDVAAATGVRYLNTHDLLMDETGGLRVEYNNGDDQGIHLNADGFAVVLQNLRTHPYL